VREAEALGARFTGSVGNTGAAQRGCSWQNALDRAQADDLSSGGPPWPTAVTSRSGARPRSSRAAGKPVPWPSSGRGGKVPYATFLTWPRIPQRRAAAPARTHRRPPRRRLPGRGVEVRLHGEPVPGVRHPAPAAHARVPEVPRGGPHDAGAHGDVPATIATYTVDASPTRSPPPVVWRPRLRGRRRFTCGADRRGPRRGEDRQPGRRMTFRPDHDRLTRCTTTSGM